MPTKRKSLEQSIECMVEDEPLGQPPDQPVTNATGADELPAPALQPTEPTAGITTRGPKIRPKGEMEPFRTDDPEAEATLAETQPAGGPPIYRSYPEELAAEAPTTPSQPDLNVPLAYGVLGSL